MEAPEVRRSVEELTQELYEASDPNGIPWNKRGQPSRDPWLQVARKQITQSETEAHGTARVGS